MIKMQISAIEWKQMSEDGLGAIELTLETDYREFRTFEDAITGVHRTSVSGVAGANLKISQPIILQIKCPASSK